MKHIFLAFSSEPSDRYGYKGEFRKLIGWSCNNQMHAKCVCNRPLGWGQHGIASLLLLMCDDWWPTLEPRIINPMNYYDVRMPSNLDPPYHFGPVSFGDYLFSYYSNSHFTNTGHA